MSSERLQQLRDMLAEEPNDVFLRYAIALELKRAGHMEQAIDDLLSLVADEPKHVPSYHQLALMLADLGRTQDAMDACQAGALQALAQGDQKARAEIMELHNTLADTDA